MERGQYLGLPHIQATYCDHCWLIH